MAILDRFAPHSGWWIMLKRLPPTLGPWNGRRRIGRNSQTYINDLHIPILYLFDFEYNTDTFNIGIYIYICTYIKHFNIFWSWNYIIRTFRNRLEPLANLCLRLLPSLYRGRSQKDAKSFAEELATKACHREHRVHHSCQGLGMEHTRQIGNFLFYGELEYNQIQ